MKCDTKNVTTQETKIVKKLKMSKFDKTQELKLCVKTQNSNSDKTKCFTTV